MANIIRKIFGTQNDRELKSIYPIVSKINALEPQMKQLSDSDLRAKTDEFKSRLRNGETLEQILPEAFAVVRETSQRVLGLRHFDVQLVGGIALHRGKIAEMRTGEGKTLTATLPVYLNALTGKGVHLVTVNEYLAKRDCEQMGLVYRFLGLSAGVIVHGLTDAQRQQNYNCDITYGTNSEFGFDYLRDNMKFRLEDYVQRDLNFAIVDEVDSILIDEARTPLIISGPTDDSSELYIKINRHLLEDGGLTKEIDYTVDEKTKSASLTESGMDKMEKRMGVTNLYDPSNIEILHHVNQALRAHVIYKSGVDYLVRDGEVLIVDEFTGRIMPGRRWSDGLHQAIEAKEGVKIENENQTLATITYQNYFRMYEKLSGMTGTADTEAIEFKEIYKLDVTVIPTNMPMIRKDNPDVIYKSQAGKFKAVIEEIKSLQNKGQPVLVGTVSVEKSELLHKMLTKEGIRHSVLNAKQHEREAYVVAQAGRKGSVTISTNMAGRGTDILLGGQPDMLAEEEVGKLSAKATEEEKLEWQKKYDEAKLSWKKRCDQEKEEVLALGGLFILGTERHESRRIDNQLRGRSGRQGDPGESRFYLSFEDDLLRIFGQNAFLQKTVSAMEEDVPIVHRMTTKSIEQAQKKVEGHNYDIRKHLLEYDDVMNQQRKVIYAWRKEVLKNDNLKEMVHSLFEDQAVALSDEFFPNGRLKRNENGEAVLNFEELVNAVKSQFFYVPQFKENEIIPFNGKGLKDLLVLSAQSAYESKEKTYGGEIMRHMEKVIFLTTIDQLWKDHLLAMDHLREGIGLQGYGQKDPLVAYKKEGFRFFGMMMNQITTDVIKKLFAFQIEQSRNIEEQLEEEHQETFPEQEMQYNITESGDLIPTQSNHIQPNKEVLPDLAHLHKTPKQMTLSHGPGASGPISQGASTRGPVVHQVAKAGRNDPCPCGSGKKYKKCHGIND